jgi:hypothetical protein
MATGSTKIFILFHCPLDGEQFKIAVGEFLINDSRDVRFGFVAVFRVENEVGIDENISVGYKDKRL